jgi:hypothetical protein
MVEMFQQIGDALGVVWAYFEDESGQLTIPAMLLLAGLALAIAARCALATLPAKQAGLSSVVAFGASVTLVFGLVGLYFLAQVASAGLQ